MHAFDRQTDRKIERRQQGRALYSQSHGKNARYILQGDSEKYCNTKIAISGENDDFITGY